MWKATHTPTDQKFNLICSAVRLKESGLTDLRSHSVRTGSRHRESGANRCSVRTAAPFAPVSHSHQQVQQSQVPHRPGPLVRTRTRPMNLFLKDYSQNDLSSKVFSLNLMNKNTHSNENSLSFSASESSLNEVLFYSSASWLRETRPRGQEARTRESLNLGTIIIWPIPVS